MIVFSLHLLLKHFQLLFLVEILLYLVHLSNFRNFLFLQSSTKKKNKQNTTKKKNEHLRNIGNFWENVVFFCSIQIKIIVDT